MTEQHWCSTEQKVLELIDVVGEDDIPWNEVSMWTPLSDQFIIQYHDRLDWPRLCKWQKLSEDIIDWYHDRVNWYWISTRHTRGINCKIFSDDFARKYMDDILWIWCGNMVSDSVKVELILKGYLDDGVLEWGETVDSAENGG